jgi:hypothetical protein
MLDLKGEDKMNLLEIKIKLAEDEPAILKKFFDQLKDTLATAFGYPEGEADFEAYRWIIQNTNKPVNECVNIFEVLPEESRKNILEHMGYKTEADFKTAFRKGINIYRQSNYRRNLKGDDNG